MDAAERDALIDRALVELPVDNAAAALRLSIRVQQVMAVLARVELAGMVLLLQVVVAYTPGSVVHKAIAASGPLAWVPMWALAALAAVALLDVLVNDLLPHRFELPTALEHWELIYVGLGIGSASIAFLVGKSTDAGAAPAIYVFLAAVSGVLAIADLIQRKGTP